MSDLKKNITDKFTNTYVSNLWGRGGSNSKSGMGSELAYTVNFRRELLGIIEDKNIKKMFDCSCGDWYWMKEIKESLPTYIGNDVVKPLVDENNLKYGSDNISFVANDMLSQLKTYSDNELDLIMCRHTLEHLPSEYSFEVLTEIKRVSKYAIITSAKDSNKENSEINMDGFTGRMVNLDKEPYKAHLGTPTYKFFDTKGAEFITVTDSPDGCFGYLYNFE